MDQGQFEALLRYYLSCLDAEEAVQLKLRKNQEYKTHIFFEASRSEQLFSRNLPQLELFISESRQKEFIERKALGTETLIDLYYGFPVYLDEKDMLFPLFYVEVQAKFTQPDTVVLIPKTGRLCINRMHFVKDHGAEEIQSVCEELEGEFGSFEARLEAAKQYIPSLKDGSERWINRPVLFRTNLKGSKSELRYDLVNLLKDKGVLSHDTALRFFVQGMKEGAKEKGGAAAPFVLETGVLNDQQEEAVKQGLVSPLFVVTGPPGTGKTQVVQALISSASFGHQTVLFSSNNNMPVDGVYERLGQGMGRSGSWMMRLGNQTKREQCRKTISTLIESLMKSDVLQPDIDQEIKTFANIERRISEIRVNLKKAQRLQDQIGGLILEEEGMVNRLPEGVIDQVSGMIGDPKPFEQGRIKTFENHSAPGFGLWLRLRLFGYKKFKDRHNVLLRALIGNDKISKEYDTYALTDELPHEAVDRTREAVESVKIYQGWAMCVLKRRRLEDKIRHYPTVSELRELKQEKSQLSRTLFHKRWLGNIHSATQEALAAFNNYFKDIDDYNPGRHKRIEKSFAALKRFFPVWMTTNPSAGKILPFQPGLFDLVVIDEAGQCDIPSVLPLLYRAKQAVIIGDPHQFKHITSLRSDLEHQIAEKAGVGSIYDDWSFTRRSAFDRGFASASSTSFLIQHYRCHPDIIEFSNRNFYQGKLVPQVRSMQFQNRLPIKESGLIWHNTPGRSIRVQKGAWNPAEIERAASMFELWSRQGLFSQEGLTYGVVTPFSRQALEMRKALSKANWFSSVEGRFTIGTVHSFQGSECDVLIYSPVVCGGMETYLVNFAASQSDLINVTVTRARNLLYIVGDLHACQSVPKDTPLYKLADYAEQLRQKYHDPLNAAENAMAAILDDQGFSYVSQYPLGQYRLDFMINASSGERYDVEVDGDVHLGADAVDHDSRRDAYVLGQGFKVLRFSARDVLHKPEAVKERLMRV